MDKQSQRDDWRWQGTTSTGPFRIGDRVYPTGEILRTSIPVNAFGQSVSLPMPNVSACLLHLSFNQWELADSIRRTFKPHEGSLHTSVSETMDFFESIMASVVLAFGSLEAFTNFVLPPNAQFTEKRKRRGIFCVKEKSNIERDSTETKLGDILPAVLEYDSPKGTTLWNQFKVLKDTRDRITHFKMVDQVPEVRADHLWGIWVGEDCPKYPEIAYAMIEHIASHMKHPPLWTTQFNK